MFTWTSFVIHVLYYRNMSMTSKKKSTCWVFHLTENARNDTNRNSCYGLFLFPSVVMAQYFVAASIYTVESPALIHQLMQRMSSRKESHINIWNALWELNGLKLRSLLTTICVDVANKEPSRLNQASCCTDLPVPVYVSNNPGHYFQKKATICNPSILQTSKQAHFLELLVILMCNNWKFACKQWLL